MTQLAFDNFDTNGATLGASWTETLNGWNVTSQEAAIDGDAISVAKYNVVTPPNSQWAEVTLGASITTLTDEGAGPSVCIQNSNNFYQAQVNTVESRIYKRITSTFQQVGGDGAAGAAGDVFRLERNGTGLVLLKNGSATITTSNAELTGGGFGMWNTKTASTVTSWRGGDFNADVILMGQTQM